MRANAEEGNAGPSRFERAPGSGAPASERDDARLPAPESSLRTMLDTMIDPLVVLRPVRDEAGRIVDFEYTEANTAACQANGLTYAEQLGKRLCTLLPELVEVGVFDGYVRVIETGEPLVLDDFEIVERFRGEVVVTAVDIRARRTGDAIVSSWRNVTDRVRALEAISEARTELDQAQRLAHVGSWSWESDRDVVTWSDELFRIFGLEPAAAAPAFADQEPLHAPESWARINRLVARALETGEPWESSIDVVRPDGSLRHVVARGEVIPDAPGAPTRLRGTVADVTELTELQRSMAQAARLESLGRLASGVAHDVNNILYGMELIGGMVRRDATSPEVASEGAEIVDAAAKGKEMTRALLAFAKGGSGERQRTEPGPFVRETLELIGRLLGPTIEIRTSIRRDLPSIRVDRAGFRQALVNLAVNARDAMPSGGRLAVALDAVVLDAGAATRAGIKAGGYVRLSVADAGTGMTPDVVDRVFEPFFSTKPANVGTGLGLPMTYGFAKANGGGITVESKAGRGSTFRLFLPVD